MLRATTPDQGDWNSEAKHRRPSGYCQGNIHVRALRDPKVCLKLCIVPIFFPHGEVSSRSSARTNAAIRFSRSSLIVRPH